MSTSTKNEPDKEKASSSSGEDVIKKVGSWALGVVLLLVVMQMIGASCGRKFNPAVATPEHVASAAELQRKLELAEITKDLREVEAEIARDERGIREASGVSTGATPVDVRLVPLGWPAKGAPVQSQIAPETKPYHPPDVRDLKFGVYQDFLIGEDGWTPYLRRPRGTTIAGKTIPFDAPPPFEDPFQFPDGSYREPGTDAMLIRYGSGSKTTGDAPLTGMRLMLLRQ